MLLWLVFYRLLYVPINTALSIVCFFIVSRKLYFVIFSKRSTLSAYTVKKYLWVPDGGQGPPYLVFPKSFSISRPGGEAPRLSVRVLGGMLHISQWMKSPLGASGSMHDNAKLFVSDGGFCHVSSGDTSFPSHVYSGGMGPLFSKSGLVSFIIITLP